MEAEITLGDRVGLVKEDQFIFTQAYTNLPEGFDRGTDIFFFFYHSLDHNNNTAELGQDDLSDMPMTCTSLINEEPFRHTCPALIHPNCVAFVYTQFIHLLILVSGDLTAFVI